MIIQSNSAKFHFHWFANSTTWWPISINTHTHTHTTENVKCNDVNDDGDDHDGDNNDNWSFVASNLYN